MGVTAQLFAPLFAFLLSAVKFILLVVLVFLLQVLVRFVLDCKCFPFTCSAEKLRTLKIRRKGFDFYRWLLVDFKERKQNMGKFKEFGFTFFVGRQGSGKTSAMVEYLGRMKKLYPKCVIVCNFKCEFADFIMMDWLDLLNVRNGVDGVIFAIDEIHSEYSSASSKDVPESLISEVSQQRKQCVKIVGTAQFFSRVAKPLREQSSTVITCSNLFGRLVSTKTYDAEEYSTYVDNAVTIRKKLKPRGKYSFVLSDELRSCFDTYEKINRMRRLENKKAGISQGVVRNR